MVIVFRKTFIVPVILLALVGLFLHDYWSLDFDPEIIKGKRVIITGASRGIGRHVARHYASLGAKILLTARNEDLLIQVKQECESAALESGLGGEVHFLAATQGSQEEAKAVVDEATTLFGGIDVLFLNHAVSTLGFWKGSAVNMTDAATTMTINYLGYLYLASSAQSELEKSKGNIVVVSSATSRWPMPGVSHYGASKFAIDGFFRSLDVEFRLLKVDVSVTICILGLIKTKRYIDNMEAFNSKGQDSIAFRLGGDPQETAVIMIKAAALRKREIRYPFSQMVLGDLMQWMPEPARLYAMKMTLPMVH